MQENKKIGLRKRWKGEREGKVLQEELRHWDGPKVVQQGWSQDTGQEKRRRENERLRKTVPGKNTLFNERKAGRKDQEKRRDNGKLFPKSKERSLRMIHQLKNPRKFWSLSSILQKRQHENAQRGQANAKDLSSRQNEEFREKSGRKIFFRGLDDTRQNRGPDEKRDQGVVHLVVESDDQAKGKKRQKNPKIRALKKASLSGKVTTNKHLHVRKEASDEKKDFGLRMDFVDCKCKFGRKPSDDDDDEISSINNHNGHHDQDEYKY